VDEFAYGGNRWITDVYWPANNYGFAADVVWGYCAYACLDAWQYLPRAAATSTVAVALSGVFIDSRVRQVGLTRYVPVDLWECTAALGSCTTVPDEVDANWSYVGEFYDDDVSAYLGTAGNWGVVVPSASYIADHQGNYIAGWIREESGMSTDRLTGTRLGGAWRLRQAAPSCPTGEPLPPYHLSPDSRIATYGNWFESTYYLVGQWVGPQPSWPDFGAGAFGSEYVLEFDREIEGLRNWRDPNQSMFVRPHRAAIYTSCFVQVWACNVGIEMCFPESPPDISTPGWDLLGYYGNGVDITDLFVDGRPLGFRVDFGNSCSEMR